MSKHAKFQAIQTRLQRDYGCTPPQIHLTKRLLRGYIPAEYAPLFLQNADKAVAQQVLETLIVQQGKAFVWLYLLAAQYYEHPAAYEQLLADLLPEFARRMAQR
ncbi:MAG: hypothetical protein IT324_08095 [Anaerolineae bacterium]|nr:hypothetical protein [Anaerolineae bacterium]